IEEALDRLDEARAETEQATDRAENELEREQRARVADMLKRLKERQEALTAEANRAQRRLQQAVRDKERVRPAQQSIRTLAENQKDLGNEVAEVAKKELANARVFARVVKQSAEAMVKAGERLKELPEALDTPDKLPDEETARHQAR